LGRKSTGLHRPFSTHHHRYHVRHHHRYYCNSGGGGERGSGGGGGGGENGSDGGGGYFGSVVTAVVVVNVVAVVVMTMVAAVTTPATHRHFLMNINSANEIQREQKKQIAREICPHPGVGVRKCLLRELLDSRCTKRRALQWRSQNCSRARAWNSSLPLNLVFFTASCFGSENYFLNQWHRFNRASRKQITTAPVG
jgi:hypothetical protein